MKLTSSHWGVYEFEVEKGRLSALKPFVEDLDPSPIGHSIIDLLDNKTRIKTPVVRESWLTGGPGSASERRGSDRFVALNWDEAETIVAA